MTMRCWSRRAAWAGASGLGIVLLLAPALYNRFPITFYDTGGYLERWFDLTVTMGRSLAYGLFLGVTAGGLSADGGSLWGTIAIQAALTVWVLGLTCRSLIPEQGPLGFLAIVAILTVATGLPWYAAQVMPDILEPLMVLSIYILAFQRCETSRAERAGLVLLIALAVACHMAHLALAVGLVAALCLARIVLRAREASPSLPALGVAAGLVALIGADAGLAGYPGLTPGGESFVFGRLVQDGIAQRFLDEHCPSPAYRLCAYRDRMPKTADDWIWAKGSPFADIGGWEGGADEMARLTREAVRAYPLENLRSALASMADQLTRVRLGVGLVEWHGHTIAMVHERLPGHEAAYQASRQQRKEIAFTTINGFQAPLALVAFALTAAGSLWLFRRHQEPGLATLGGFVTVALLGNAFICGALSNPNDRYQNRLIWLAVLWVTLTTRRLAAVPLRRMAG